jgi:hypothetical protein
MAKFTEFGQAILSEHSMLAAISSIATITTKWTTFTTAAYERQNSHVRESRMAGKIVK